MADHKAIGLQAETHQYISLLTPGMVRIIQYQPVRIAKCPLRFYEGNTMFGNIGARFPRILGKRDIAHCIMIAIHASPCLSPIRNPNPHSRVQTHVPLPPTLNW